MKCFIIFFKFVFFSNKIPHDVLTLRVVCTNVDPHLIADQRNFRVKYLQNGEEN